MFASRLAADEAGPTRRDVGNFGRIWADDEIVKLAYSVISYCGLMMLFLTRSAPNVILITLSGKLKTLNQIGGASAMN